MISLIFGLIIGALSVVFALQNVFPVTVNFLNWDLTASLALIVSISIFAGFVIGILITAPSSIVKTFAISRLQKENKKLAEESEIKIQTPEVIIESGEKTDQTL